MSNNPVKVAVTGAAGQIGYAILFRIASGQLLGADTIRSTWIRQLSLDAAHRPPQVTIEGAGRGHGVGLCQWGARAMAAAGATAPTILAFYFPGTSITNVDAVPN